MILCFDVKGLFVMWKVLYNWFAHEFVLFQ